jgi:hypothetical protein
VRLISVYTDSTIRAILNWNRQIFNNTFLITLDAGASGINSLRVLAAFSVTACTMVKYVRNGTWSMDLGLVLASPLIFSTDRLVALYYYILFSAMSYNKGYRCLYSLTIHCESAD